MRTTHTGSLVWIVTDSDGQIEALSSAAAALLGLRPNGADRNLLVFFPRHRRVLAVDMEVALTGWPSTRTVVVTPMASRPRTIRYLVSRRVLGGAVELQWTIEMVDEDFAAAS